MALTGQEKVYLSEGGVPVTLQEIAAFISTNIEVGPIDSAGGSLTFPGGTLQAALQALADDADPGV